MRQWLNRGSITFVIFFLFVTPVWAQRPTESVHGRSAAAREVLVKFRDGTPVVVRRQAEQNSDVDEVEHVGGIGVARFHSRSKDVMTLVTELSRHPDVVFAEPNYVVHTFLAPNDTSFGNLWGLQNTGQTIGTVAGISGADIHAVRAWDVSTGSTANVVAVVDTGIDYTHPDLASNLWSAPAPFTVTIGGRVITCAAGTHGFNAITNTCDPRDDNNHGSHVSGTIGASGNNGLGVVGVNWTASIMAVKFLDATGSGTTANAINAIEFALQAKAIFGGQANVRVLSSSWGGGGFSQALLDEINRANASDMLFVAAAGNSGVNTDFKPSYPASYNASNVIAVAATDNRDGRASFSNYGATTVDLGAPGVNVLSTIRGGTYDYFSGTSMATPHVSGAATLILSACALGTADLKATILNSVDPIPSLTGITVTGGRLNVDKAIRSCGTSATPDFSLAVSPTSRTIAAGATTSYVVSVTPAGGFTGDVSFSVVGLPANATATFSPASIAGSGSSTLTVATTTTTPTGSFQLTITGTDGGTITHRATATLVVQPVTADFSISVAPMSQTVLRGSQTSYTVTVTPTGGFAGAVTFGVSGLPRRTTASFDPAAVMGGAGTSSLIVTAGSRASTGTFTLTITGTSGSVSRSATVTLTVNRR